MHHWEKKGDAHQIFSRDNFEVSALPTVQLAFTFPLGLLRHYRCILPGQVNFWSMWRGNKLEPFSTGFLTIHLLVNRESKTGLVMSSFSLKGRKAQAAQKENRRSWLNVRLCLEHFSFQAFGGKQENCLSRHTKLGIRHGHTGNCMRVAVNGFFPALENLALPPITCSYLRTTAWAFGLRCLTTVSLTKNYG